MKDRFVGVISKDMGKLRILLFVTILLISLSLTGSTVDAEDIDGENDKVPYGTPSWEIGDSWTYRYHLNSTGGTIEDMYQKGEVTFVVEDEVTKYVEGTSYRAYEVSYDREYFVEGENEVGEPIGSVDFEMDGNTFGTQYYRRSDLELIDGDYRNYMEGISTAAGQEIIVNITDSSYGGAIELSSFLNTPIELGDTWEREAVYDRYSDRYNSFDPSGDPFPENETIVMDYYVHHQQEIKASSEHEFETGDETYDVLELKGGDTWRWEGNEEREGSFRKYYSREVGNYVYIDLENMYDHNTGLNVTDKEMTLVEYEYEYQDIEDYGMDAYAEEEKIYSRPGEEIRYRFTVRNTGIHEDVIDFVLEKEKDWSYSWSEEELELGPASSAVLELRLDIPPDAAVDEDHGFQVIFTSLSQPKNQQILELDASVRSSFKPQIDRADPPVDTLTRLQGEKVSLSIEARCVLESRLMINWYVDGELISNGDSIELEFDEAGEYVITAEVYSGEEKATSTWDVSVREPSTSYFMYYVALVIAIVISVVIGYVYHRRKKRSEETDEESEQSVPEKSYRGPKEDEVPTERQKKPPPPKERPAPPPPPPDEG